MKIAIPVAQGRLCAHFGHCEEFEIIEADEKKRQIISTKRVTPPPHEPGVLPRWLHENGVQVVLAGGMGQRAQTLFAEQQIRTVVGAPMETPEILVAAYLEGTLQSGSNVCDH